VTTASGLRHCELNKYFDKQSNGRRIEVEVVTIALSNKIISPRQTWLLQSRI